MSVQLEKSNVDTGRDLQLTAEAFAEKMVDVLNKGALALVTNIGHRTGLFDVMFSTRSGRFSTRFRACTV